MSATVFYRCALVSLCVLAVTQTNAQNAGAEKYKVPVSATIQPRHNFAAESVGDVVVTYADGTTDLWTLKGNCKLPKVSPDGEVGWVVCEMVPNSKTLKLYDGVPIGSQLVICFKGQRTAALRSAKPFIEDWVFQEDGAHVVMKSRAAHGPAVIELFAIQSATAEAAIEAFQKDLPDWAQPFRD